MTPSSIYTRSTSTHEISDQRIHRSETCRSRRATCGNFAVSTQARLSGLAVESIARASHSPDSSRWRRSPSPRTWQTPATGRDRARRTERSTAGPPDAGRSCSCGRCCNGLTVQGGAVASQTASMFAAAGNALCISYHPIHRVGLQSTQSSSYDRVTYKTILIQQRFKRNRGLP